MGSLKMMVNEEEAVFTLGPDNDLKKVLANLNSGNHIINYNEGQCVDGSTFKEVDLAETINWYLEIVILLPLGLIGIFANLTSIPILLSRKMSSIFNQTLAVLAMVDTTYIILDTYRTVVRNLDPEELLRCGRLFIFAPNSEHCHECFYFFDSG